MLPVSVIQLPPSKSLVPTDGGKFQGTVLDDHGAAGPRWARRGGESRQRRLQVLHQNLKRNVKEGKCRQSLVVQVEVEGGMVVRMAMMGRCRRSFGGGGAGGGGGQ